MDIFYQDKYGQLQDAGIHDSILDNPKAHHNVTLVSFRKAIELGVSTELASVLFDFIDENKAAPYSDPSEGT